MSTAPATTPAIQPQPHGDTTAAIPLDRDLADPITGFMAHLDAEHAASAHTLRAYAGDLADFTRWLAAETGETFRPAAVGVRQVRGYLARLVRSGRARSTVRRRVACLKSLFKWLVRMEVVARNPATNLRTPRPARPLPAVLDEEEVLRLLGAPDTRTWRGRRDRALLEVLYSTGMRVGEASAVNVADLDLLQREVRILAGKGRRERIGILGGPAVQAVEEWLPDRATLLSTRGRDEEALFLNPYGTRLTARSMGRAFEAHAKAAGLDGRATPHTLRHSCATHLFDRGADIRSVQAILGHVAISSTVVYTHVSPARMQADYGAAHPLCTGWPRLPIPHLPPPAYAPLPKPKREPGHCACGATLPPEPSRRRMCDACRLVSRKQSFRRNKANIRARQQAEKTRRGTADALPTGSAGWVPESAQQAAQQAATGAAGGADGIPLPFPVTRRCQCGAVLAPQRRMCDPCRDAARRATTRRCHARARSSQTARETPPAPVASFQARSVSPCP